MAKVLNVTGPNGEHVDLPRGAKVTVVDTGEPRGMCRCGHTGNGPNSQHADRYAEGHGACEVKGCQCVQFTWVAWLPGYPKLPSGGHR